MVSASRFGIGLAASALLVASCQTSAGPSTSGGAAAPKLNITLLTFSNPNESFWVPVVKGANDAARELGVNLNFQFTAGDFAKLNDDIETAIGQKVDGIAVAIPNDNAVTASVCKARQAGIPILAFNNNAATGQVLQCEMSFVGQNFADAGFVIGQRMVADYHLTAGDTVFAPVEYPTAVYAVSRFAGVKKALDAVGAKADLVGVGVNLPDVETTMVQYLLGHPNTKAIIGLGGTPMTEAEKALGDAKIKIPVGGFDLSPQIIAAIKDGTIDATLDQAPYAQGFYAVSELVLMARYGIFPPNINTGNGLVDKSNVAQVAALVGTYR